VASRDASLLAREMTDAASYRERIRAHRSIALDDVQCGFEAPGAPPVAALTVMVPLRSAPWGVVIQQHEETAFAGSYAEWRGLTLAAALFAAVTLLLSNSLSRSVVAPIRQLSRQAAAVRAGDLSTPITVAGDEEVESLARTLDDARARLGSTLAELQALNENLEAQVAARTKTIEAKYHDLALLHAVAELSTEEREPDRLAPGMLRLIAAHYGFEAVAIVTTPKARRSATYVVPGGASLPWLPTGVPPADWRQRDIVYQDRAVATLFHPHTGGIDEQVMEALDNHLAVSLHRANLWKRALEQDEQRQVLVRRLLGAAEDERRRLARELHDEISQLLTVIQLSLARVEADSPELARARELLTQTQVDMHRIIYDLRPSLLDDLGLSAAIQAHARDHLTREGLTVSLEIEEHLPPRPAVETAVFRIYQELITIILRHANAEHVSIELYERDGKLVLAVEDDGVGFDPESKSEGVGITGMRERAGLVNGTITFDSEPGMGTNVVLEIPVS
jgi:signal transduction histidine kinase